MCLSDRNWVEFPVEFLQNITQWMLSGRSPHCPLPNEVEICTDTRGPKTTRGAVAGPGPDRPSDPSDPCPKVTAPIRCTKSRWTSLFFSRWRVAGQLYNPLFELYCHCGSAGRQKARRVSEKKGLGGPKGTRFHSSAVIFVIVFFGRTAFQFAHFAPFRCTRCT